MADGAEPAASTEASTVEGEAAEGEGSLEGLEAKLAAGHMLPDDELEQLKMAAHATSATATSERLSAKLAAGHMLDEKELEELKNAAATNATATAERLSAKLAAGHMLSDEELEELRTVAAASASMRADELSAKLAAGHMLEEDELAELKAHAAASSSETAERLSSKLAAGHMLDEAEMAELRTAASEVATARAESLSSKLAAGHMLDEAELAELKAHAAASANATADRISAKLTAGHMLDEAELEELKTAASEVATARAESLSSKLAAGHMLDEAELAELKAHAYASASATADRLSSKLAAGHMLDEAEMVQLRTAASTSASMRADSLSAKLAAGHMLEDDELAELKSAANMMTKKEPRPSAQPVQAHRGPHPPSGPRTVTSRTSASRPQLQSTRQQQPQRPPSPSKPPPAPQPQKPWIDGGQPYLETWAAAVPIYAPQAAQIYGHADEARRKASKEKSRNLANAQAQAAAHSAAQAQLAFAPLRTRSANTASRGEMMQQLNDEGGAGRPGTALDVPRVLRPGSRSNLRGHKHSTEPPHSACAPSLSARAAPVGRLVGVGAIPAPPPGARSARSARPTPRALTALPVAPGHHFTGQQSSDLLQKVENGQLLSPEELEELRMQDAVGNADAIKKRLQAGHMLSEEEQTVLKLAASREKQEKTAQRWAEPEAGGLNVPNEATSSAVLSRPRSRGGLKSRKHQQQQALAGLQQHALALLADGLDIGDMRLADLVELNPATLSPLKTGTRPSTTKGGQRVRRKASGKLQVYSAYQPSALPSINGRGRIR